MNGTEKLNGRTRNQTKIKTRRLFNKVKSESKVTIILKINKGIKDHNIYVIIILKQIKETDKSI